jgi:hypothetical protein
VIAGSFLVWPRANRTGNDATWANVGDPGPAREGSTPAAPTESPSVRSSVGLSLRVLLPVALLDRLDGFAALGLLKQFCPGL